MKLQVPKMITSKINKSSNISLPNLEDSNPKYLKVFCGGKKCKKCTKAHSVFIVRKREFYWSLSFILELSSNVISDSCPSNLNPCKAFCFIIFLWIQFIILLIADRCPSAAYCSSSDFCGLMHTDSSRWTSYSFFLVPPEILPTPSLFLLFPLDRSTGVS